MKTILPLCLLAALTTLAHAQEKKPPPDLNKSPWSAETSNRSDGYTGTMDTIIKRDMGEGWAVGGKMSAPYQDPKIGGSGPPTNQLDSSRSGTTLFGPYLEKKF